MSHVFTLTDLDRFGLSCFLAGFALALLVGYAGVHLALWRLAHRTRRLTAAEVREMAREMDREGR